MTRCSLIHQCDCWPTISFRFVAFAVVSINDKPLIDGRKASSCAMIFTSCYQLMTSCSFNSSLPQTALSLAVAERRFEFEHRDLHWGNILIAPTTEKFVEYRVDGKVVKLLTHGVKATIIDYSLSRMVYDGAVLYDNLARDEELFQSNGDYQFDIYRLMRDRVE